VRLTRLPGVHRPVSDTWMLAAELRRERLSGAVVADLCTGTGALAIAAARAGADRVYAVDVSRRAALSARVNARRAGVRVAVRVGDLFDPLGALCLDVIVSNPPYIPAETDRLPRHRRRTALDAGRNGRALLDRICREAAPRLAPAGRLLVVHSSVCGVERTCALLREHGLEACVAARERGALGPVLRARAEMLRERGLLGAQDAEEIVVVRGAKPPLETSHAVPAVATARGSS
jgi:release factor glutamine methyltransferase